MKHTPSHIARHQLRLQNIAQLENPRKHFKMQGMFVAVHRYHRWDEPMSNISAGIRVFDKSFWNHTAIILIKPNGHIWVMESNADGVVWMPFEDWATHPKLGDRIWQVYPPLRNEPLETYTQFLGCKYDYASLLWYQPIYKTTGLWFGKTGIEASERTYCTEIYSFAQQLPRPWLQTTGSVLQYYHNRRIDPI